MPKTKTEIATKALQQLGVISGTETPETHDLTYCEDQLDLLVAEVQQSHEVWLGSLDAVPNEVAIPLARLLAVEVAEFYTLPAEPRSRAVIRLAQAAKLSPVSIDTMSYYF